MQRAYLISLDFFDNININDEKTDFTDLVKFLLDTNDNDVILAYSRENSRIENTKNTFPIKSERLKIISRNSVKAIIKKNNAKNSISFVVIGRKNKDFQEAVNNKLILITPTWLGEVEDKANQYGIKINNTMEFKAFIETLVNQKSWYSKLHLPDDTFIFSLSDGRSRGSYPVSSEERDVVEQFNKILKKGSRNYYEMYLYHFLSSISNNKELFNDINYWGFFPSSSGHVDTNEMFVFKEKVRHIMKGQPLKHEDYQKYKNLLVRHTPATKGQYTKNHIRIENDCKKHFSTIRLNKGYINKLKGKNICIFDDYLTHGSSFESARNLFRKAGVNKLIFVTLGRFENPYQYQEYNLNGDIYSNSYDYELINRYEIPKSEFEINEQAKNEVENLHEIFNL